MKYVLWICLFGFLSSCATDPGNIEIDLGTASLNDIRQAVFAVIGTPRTTSENQREYQSDYFPRAVNPKFNGFEEKERLYCHVTILGESRPYTLQVQTLVENKTPTGYEEVGEDPGFTAKIASAIKKRLNEGLKRRNIIDDYKAF